MGEVKLVDRYTDWQFLGVGGVGTVYRAWDERVGRYVAIKQLLDNVAEQPGMGERFEREVNTLARLDDQGIVKVHDYTELTRPGTTQPQASIIMEHVQGLNLQDMIEARPDENTLDGRPLELSVPVVLDVLSVLEVAHGSLPAIIHRDIKPSNIMRTQSGKVKVVDFGIARAATDASGSMVGTPVYQAPEQLRRGGKVTPATDLYAVGGLLYELLTGDRAYDVIHAWGDEPRPSARDEKLWPFDALILKAMSREQEDRFQTAAEMRSALEEARRTYEAGSGEENRKNSAPPVDPGGERQPAPSGSHRPRLLKSVVLALVVTLAATVAIGLSNEADRTSTWNRVMTYFGDEDGRGAPEAGGSQDPLEPIPGLTKQANYFARYLSTPMEWSHGGSQDFPQAVVSSALLPRPVIGTGRKWDIVTVSVPKIDLSTTEKPFPADLVTNVCTPEAREINGDPAPPQGIYLAFSGSSEDGGQDGTIEDIVMWGNDDVELQIVRAACQPDNWPATTLNKNGSALEPARKAAFPIPKTVRNRWVYGLVAITEGNRVVAMRFRNAWETTRGCEAVEVCLRKSEFDDFDPEFEKLG